MSSKDLSGVPVLSKDNYSEWSRIINAYFRINNLYRLVHGTEPRPKPVPRTDTDDDTTKRDDWDSRAQAAAGAISMRLDSDNASHVRGIDDNPVRMWTKLDEMHNHRTPAARFNAMHVLYNIRKENDETLAQLVARVETAMTYLKSLRPVSSVSSTPTTTATSTTSTTATAVYTLDTMDEEFTIMTLFRALPDDFKHVQANLGIQQNLSLEMVKQAFLSEDAQRQNADKPDVTALRAFTHQQQSYRQNSSYSPSPNGPPAGPSSSTQQPRQDTRQCWTCGKYGHVQRFCSMKQRGQGAFRDSRPSANAASDAQQDSSPGPAQAALANVLLGS